MRRTTIVSVWNPSIHLIDNTILFASADEFLIKKDMPYGKPKKDEKTTVTEEGGYVSIILCAASAPFTPKLTIFVKRNSSRYLIIADDLREESKATPILGLAALMPESGLVKDMRRGWGDAKKGFFFS